MLSCKGCEADLILKRCHIEHISIGYFTLGEYKEFFKELGAKIIFAEQLLEPGYPDNLNKYLDLLNEKGEAAEYPDSNCIIIVEK